MDKETEQRLIRQSASGNTQAFRALVEANQAFAVSLAFRFMNDIEDAQDIVQEAFVRVWKNLAKYDFTFRFKTWLGKIITNLCLDAVKAAKKRHRTTPMTADPTENKIRSTGSDEQLEFNELKETLRQLANELTPKQRAVFVLRDLEELEPDEVCKALDMPNGTMKSNLYYARLHIKAGLQRYYSTTRL